MDTEVETWQFADYLKTLSKQRAELADMLQKLKLIVDKLAWNDNFFEQVRGVLNTHIDEFNRIFAELGGCASAMREMQNYQEQYLYYANK